MERTGDAACDGDAADTLWLAPHGPARAAIVLLHGLDMSPARLAPLLRPLKLPAWVALPAGPVERAGGERAWWPVDDAARAARIAHGPSDLHDRHPEGRAPARARVHAAARALRERAPGRPLIVGGFSQGAMLALDAVLQSPPLGVDALFLWSGSRLAFDEWRPALVRLEGVPVLLAHGRGDPNFAFDAGLALREALAGAGARVRWSPFDGGHEIPVSAWIGLRRLVKDIGEGGAAR